MPVPSYPGPVVHLVPALPVLVPLVAVALAALTLALRRRHALTAPRLATVVLVCGYGAALVRAVLLPMPVSFVFDPLAASWWEHVQVIPLLTADPVGLALNVALFVPFGLLLPLLARDVAPLPVLLVTVGVSLGIETTQFLAVLMVHGDRVADVDDLIGNTVGGLLGYAVFRVVTSLPAVARLAAAATWPGPGTVAPCNDASTGFRFPSRLLT